MRHSFFDGIHKHYIIEFDAIDTTDVDTLPRFSDEFAPRERGLNILRNYPLEFRCLVGEYVVITGRCGTLVTKDLLDSPSLLCYGCTSLEVYNKDVQQWVKLL